MRRFFNLKGQSIIEIALMTPLILVALYVPFDFGVAIFTGHLTQNAVRDGARVASATDLLDDTKARTLAAQVYDNLPELLDPADRQVTVTLYGNGSPDCSKFVEVSAEGTYNFFLYRLIALLGFTPPDAITIARATRMRYEFQPTTNGGAGSTLTACTSVSATGTYPAT
ncbi:MAG TPA: TadE/TadG family type IV pilus assembly protein [candidate division Zixibacteria bacterium]|nr:TadE/TadG family type IV pilus assembly protein [candidate division Zixibacteria bacterium]